MFSDDAEREPPHRPLQASLHFAGERADDVDDASAKRAVGSHVEPTAPAADQAGEAFMDPGDPDADLEAMSSDDLRGHLIELNESTDRAEAAVRRLKAIFLLQRRGQLAKRRWARETVVDPSPAKSRDAGLPRKVGFRTAIDRVTKTGGVLGAERFAEWLAEDLWDVRSIPDFRRIANGLRDGVLTRELVSEAWRRSKRGGIRNRSAFFRRFVWDRSPWAAGQGGATRR